MPRQCQTILGSYAADDDGDGSSDHQNFNTCKTLQSDQSPVSLQAGCPSCHPTEGVKATTALANVCKQCNSLTAKTTWFIPLCNVINQYQTCYSNHSLILTTITQPTAVGLLYLNADFSNVYQLSDSVLLSAWSNWY